MDKNFWLNRWRKGDIGFHRDIVHDCLRRHWSKLDLKPGSTVFVPLCGKTTDMVWLAQQGHNVIGVELSDLAIKDFFDIVNLKPTTKKQDGFTISTGGPYELWCGDIFAMPPTALNDTEAVYDRASLVAFPAADQERYAEFLATKLPQNAKHVVVALNYDPTEMDGPPFPISHDRIEKLFSENFAIEHIEQASVLDKNENLIKRGLTWVEESIYLLSRSTSPSA